MLVRLTGKLETVGATSAIVATDAGARCYEILLPAVTAETLTGRSGDDVTLHTIEFHEAQSQGGSFTPRIVGFLSQQEREFFQLFTTVKGVGTRKALKSLALPFGRIASAIAQRDAATLVTLPEIGKRGAETIIAELHGKVDRFLIAGETSDPGAFSTGGGASSLGSANQAVDALVRLGENRGDAVRLVERVIEAKPELDAADDILAAAVSLR